MLTRKPNKGERVTDGLKIWTITDFGKIPELLWMEDNQGNPDCFIWKFKEGLNRKYTIIPKEEK